MIESGLPGFDIGQWFGVLAPAGTPRDIVARLNAEIIRLLNLPDVKARLLEQGAEPVGNTPEQFGAFIKSEISKYTRIVKDAGIKPE